MNYTTSIFLIDSYKLAHANQYPEGTELVFSNFTPRGDKYAPYSYEEIKEKITKQCLAVK